MSWKLLLQKEVHPFWQNLHTDTKWILYSRIFFISENRIFLVHRKKILSLSKLENFFQKLLVNLTNNYKEMANNFFQ